MPKVGFVVHAGNHRRKDCPVVVRLPNTTGNIVKSAVLANREGVELGAQVVPPRPFPQYAETTEQVWVAFILPQLRAGDSLEFRAELSAEPVSSPDRVSVRDDGTGSVAVEVLSELLTIYRYLHGPARPCFFPLVGPGGKRVTRSWPLTTDVLDESQDHVHHRSMWVAHGDVNRTDNWSEEGEHGFQVHRQIVSAAGGPVCGQLLALNDWTDHQKRKILEERRALTAYAVSGDARIFDLDVCFSATECDVRFGDTKEGGILAMRVASSLDAEHGGRIENSYGAVSEAECWGRRAQWCDYSGIVDGEHLGIAIFDHPLNFRHPTNWHVRDYGMYTANPFGWHDFYDSPSLDGSHVLQRGSYLIFRYRVYLHRGDAKAAEAAVRYHDYANPPKVEVRG